MPPTEEQMASPLHTYLAHCRDGRLAYQADASTGKAIFPPRVVAPETGSADLQWRISAGLGTVHATTTVYRRNQEPYNVALVDVDEGFRMMSRVEGVPSESVEVGMRVVVRMHPGDEEQPPYPVFIPLQDAQP